MNYPLVSVVVISYNSSKYIIDTLESIKNQTYKNIELIIADDRSTDETATIITKWVNKNSKFLNGVTLSIAEVNCGISANCNRGLMLTKGEWIKLIAADDLLSQDCIHSYVGFATLNSANFICSNLNYFNDEGTPVNTARTKLEKFYFKKFITLEKQQEQKKFFYRNPTFLNTPTWFISKKVYQEVNFYDPVFKTIEDQHFVYKVLDANIKISYLNKTTVLYRVHNSSVSRNRAGLDRIITEKILCYNIYRQKHLSAANISDFLAIIDFHLTFGVKNRLLKRGLQFVNPLFYKKIILQRLLLKGSTI